MVLLPDVRNELPPPAFPFLEHAEAKMSELIAIARTVVAKKDFVINMLCCPPSPMEVEPGIFPILDIIGLSKVKLNASEATHC